VTKVSYPALVADYLREDIKKLKHVNLGCPGETSDTLIEGGICPYSAGSQLNEAVEFLSTHGKSTGLITIDIGANDALACFDGADIDFQCFGETVKRLDANLRDILETLQDAAPGVPIVGMNYYNPMLVFYFDSPEFAALTAVLQAYLNLTLESAYKDFGVPVADVAGAFMSDDLVTDDLPPPAGNKNPDSVDLICAWTWMCYCAQISPELANIHPQDVGYAVIAEAFVEVLPPIQTCKKPWWHRHRF
jgi:lysophospholipase L1-like esterase